MKISIVTVVFNSVQNLEKTILSVINQTYDQIEYIIIDGVSTDGTVDIITKYSNKITHWISEPDNGLYDAMNKGIKLVTGNYVLFLNSNDTLYTIDTIKEVASLITKDLNNNPTVVYGNVVCQLDYGKVLKKPQNLDMIKKKMIFSHQATFILKEVLLKNPFDINYKFIADYHQLQTLYLSNYKFRYLDYPISLVTMEEGLTYSNFIQSINEHFDLLHNIYNKRNLFEKYKLIILLAFTRGLKKHLPSILINNLLRVKNRKKLIQ